MARAMKDSGIKWIGQIPENWNVILLKYISTCLDGKRIPLEASIRGTKSGTIPYWGAGNIVDYIDDYIFDEELILLGEDGAPFFDKNRAVAFYVNEKIWVNNHIHVLKVNSTANPLYVMFALNSVDYREYINGSILNKLTQSAMNCIRLPLPPLYEQQKIADFLDKRCEKIDTAIDNQKQIIEKLKEYKQSLITETVTKGLNPNVKLKDSGIEWIGSIPEHWEIKKLKYLFKIKKNIAGKEGFDILSVTQSGIKIKDISTNEGQIAQDYSKYQIVNIDDFIMNHMDLLTGFVDCSHFNGVTSPDYRVFCQIEPTTNSNLYYNYIFQQCYKNKIFYGLGQGVSGLGRWRLPSDMFLNFTLPQPPLSEQKEIAEYLDKKCNQIDEAIKQKEETISKLEEYKKSLIFECVTGKKEVS